MQLCVALPARASVHAHTAIICVLCVLGLAMFAIVRVNTVPQTQGMLGTVFFGLLIITGCTLPTYRLIWRLVGYLLADCVIGVGMSVGMSMLVVPSLAGDEVAACSVRTLRGVGHSVSG